MMIFLYKNNINTISDLSAASDFFDFIEQYVSSVKEYS